MDLKLFIDPVPDSCIQDKPMPHSFQQSIFINNEIIYELEGIDLVLLGLNEYRGADRQNPKMPGVEEIRKKLYSLSKNTGKCRVLDLGNLRNGPTPEDTILRLKEVCGFLYDKGVIPVLIGGSHDLTLGQYLGYEQNTRMVSLLNVDARFDLDENLSAERSHISRIIKHDPNFLFNYIHFGYQRYFVNEQELAAMERLYFESYRLGSIKENIKEMEPVIRDADMVSFDLSSIQSIYCPGNLAPTVFGFTGEEACQIAWYAGLNDKLSSFGIYNFWPGETDKVSASVVATMIWYFIEGYGYRKGDKNFMSDDYLVYEVDMGGGSSSLRFYKSKLSEKWWIEVPDPHTDSIFLRNKMVPCGYTDYEMALKGEVPQRWLNAISKMG
ncbi:MAG: formimidoylglutamase [Cyclobacteriaceae bacterium]|nr:formimidoylglutamase [Cyclobacteriaceae bacterium]